MHDWIREQAVKFWEWVAHLLALSTAAVGAMNLNNVAIVGGLSISLVVGVHSMWCRRQHLKIAREVAKQNALCANCPKVNGDD